MTDWKRYVRAHLPQLNVRAEREAEIVDEFALQLEAAYDTAVAESRSEEESNKHAISEVPDWQALARELVRVESRDQKARAPSLSPPPTTQAGSMAGFAMDLRHAFRGLLAAPARAYDLFGQHWGRTVSLAVRTSNSPMQTATTVRQLLRERDPKLAVFSVATTAELVSRAVATRRLLLWLVSGFAVIGVLIALIGLYGTVAYIMTQRTRELGVRLALGATTSEIRRLVLQRGLLLVAAGIALGSAGTFVLRRGIEAQLFGVTAMNAPAIAGTAFGLLIAAGIACLAPASRATRINPVDALRAE